MFGKKVFVSHSAKNKEIADHLCAFIARLGVKEKNIFCSSVIGQGIGNGEKLNTAIANAIQDSSLLIFLLSYDFLNSSYCMEELGVGWYLSQRGDVTCYYLVLPDIELSDLVGFVNSKIDKFTFLDNDHAEELSSLSCDLSKKLRFRMKTHNLITNAENVFLSSIKSFYQQLIDAKKARKYLLELEQNEKNELKNVIKDKEKAIEALNISLEKVVKQRKDYEASIELHTIERVLWSLSFTELVPTKSMERLEKDFWFEFVHRYEEIHSQLNTLPEDSRVEKVISMVYLANGNSQIAYDHFMTFLKLQGAMVSTYDLEFFTEKYKESLQEAITMLEISNASVKEGMYKDYLSESIEYLKKREVLLQL